MDASSDTRPPFGNCAKSCGHKRSDGSKNDGSIEFFRRVICRISSPDCSQPAGKVLSYDVTWTGKCLNLLSHVKRHLGDDMGCRSKSENPQAFDILFRHSHAVGSISYQSGAHQRCSLCIAVAFRNVKTISVICDCIFSVTAINCISGE
jgi:hypothetical protein